MIDFVHLVRSSFVSGTQLPLPPAERRWSKTHVSKLTLDPMGSLKDNHTHRLDLGGDDNQQKTSKLQTHT